MLNKNLKEVKVFKNNYKFPCQLLLSASEEIIREKLFFARKWNEPKHKFVFGTYGFLCFDIKPIDDDYLDLNIHHKYYKQGCKAWEYEDDALITLCADCHKMEHDIKKIAVLDDRGNILFYTQKCDRCGGSGVLPEFKFVKNGVCFKCHGRGDLNF